MKVFKFKGLLQKTGWLENAYVSVDKSGYITEVNTTGIDAENIEDVNGYAIPGWQNAHSHAFQFAMAGIAESHKKSVTADDFWSWRESMYQLAMTMEPDDLENVAAMLYAEMVRHGYTHVAEFHYLHHDKDGRNYNNIAEHGERLISAAQRAGINITLVPMFYQKGGFGQDPQPRQKRFISATIDDYFMLLEATKSVIQNNNHARLGFGIHSLRAVNHADIITTLDQGPKDLPFHIHISEQLKEVEDCLNFLNQRPVQWLLDHCHVNEQFHLVHATHLDEKELDGIVKEKANVVLCPSTEGNLGDGLFRLKEFIAKNGKWSIGTDSHVGLNPLEELRILDYGQRLISNTRNTFINNHCSDSGTYAIETSLIAGRNAMGNSNTDYFRVGHPLDAAVYDNNYPLINISSLDKMSSTIVYSSDVSAILGTIINGHWITSQNEHVRKQEIVTAFATSMNKLSIR